MSDGNEQATHGSVDDGRRVAMAIAAHPDDIEFGMAGTLLQLATAGYTLHYLNLSTGSCGSLTDPPDEVRRTRREEAQAASTLLGATWHAPLVDDLEIFYQDNLLRRVASVVREVQPSVVLTHSPQDYMEDHTNTSRLAVTATFARGMPNYRVDPERGAVGGDVTLYHAMPHGLCDQLSRKVVAEMYVDTTAVIQRKVSALEAHRSQKEWLDESQGMDSYVSSMLKMSRAVGQMSGRFEHAEGWRRHSHFGFCHADRDPLAQHLGEQRCFVPNASRDGRYFVA